MKSKHIVFVHGFLGWGPQDFHGLASYWGDALGEFSPSFETREAKCGPFSSFHDRACEVFAQIAGKPVDYGELHSRQAGHARTVSGYDFTGKAFVPEWSEENPVILIGHSAGAQTCLTLQRLLEENYWGGDTTANWIEAIVSIAGVLNGSLLTYIACDEQSGKVRGLASDFIGDALKILAKVHAIGDQSLYNLQLDQWIGPSDGSLATLKQKIDTTDFIGGEDNLGFDITLQGCHKANVAFGQRVATPSTYYLSLVTSASREPPLPGISFPTMNILLRETATYQKQRNDFAIPPIPDWGVGDLTIAKWRENDGALSAISQRYPFTGAPQPLGGEGIFALPETLEKGKWYFERVQQLLEASVDQLPVDHLDVVFGGSLNLLWRGKYKVAPKTIYQKLCLLFQTLP
jgi:triacylglycerol lipase